MCGICGAAWTSDSPGIDPTTLDRMVDVLAHRGPDDRGTYIETGLALGHRRLSIIDLSPLARQPMISDDGTLRIVFNGEIYNFESLRKELVAKGHRFRSESDTEVLLHLYAEDGEKMLSKLNGMFSLAIDDTKTRRFFFARDRLGKKPFFYRLEKDRVLFASELKSILQVEGISREIDPTALDDYLTYQYVPHPKTIFRGINKLPPGHFAVWQDGRFSITKYWNPDFNLEDANRSYADWSEELRSLLTDAVQLRLRSDVPLGAFLSGGIDSSIITGLAQRLSTKKIRTFSIGFPQKHYDETAFARKASEKSGTDHTELIVTPDIHGILDKLVEHYDEPFADSSAIPTLVLSELTRRSVTVALSGDGGDELFAGYQRYQAVKLGERVDILPHCVRKFLAGPMRSLIPASTQQKSTPRRLKRFFEALGMEPMERYLQWIAIFNRQRRNELYSVELAQQIGDHDSVGFLEDAATFCSQRDVVSRTSLIDVQTYLPCDILTKVDVASMACSLEVRAPLLDYRLVEFAARIPVAHKIHGRTGKFIFRDTFRELLPPEIETRGKMGFGVPIDDWFRGPLKNFVREILLDRRTTERGLFRLETVGKLLDDHFSNRFDHAYRIWALLVLELWMRRWMP